MPKKEPIKANVWEIKKSGSLQTLGGLIALFHLLQFYFWSTDGRLPLKLVEQGLPMCWSFFEGCAWMQGLPPGLRTAIFFAYGLFVALAAAVFLLTNWVPFGYGLLLFGSLFGFSLYFQDLRLSSNDGYFIVLLSLSYLFVPSKHRMMRRLIVSFFVARGLSQSAPDWLSGVWYMEHLALPVKLAEWLAAVSLLVQMIGGACLLFRDGRYFWGGWVCIFLFECTHLYIGEIMSSSLALGALVYVALDELELRKAEREYIYQSFIRPEPSFAWAGFFLGFFWLAQLTPVLGLPRQSPVRQVLDLLALHPEAAHEDCTQKNYLVFKDRIEETEIERTMARQPAMQCNPYLRYLDIKASCKELKKKVPDFVTISSSLHVYNFREKVSYRPFEVQDFCNERVTYPMLGDVRWTMNPEK